MKTYKNINLLLKDLGVDIGKSLLVATRSDGARDLMVQGIDEGLGPESTCPNPYKRRGKNGGLTDPGLIAVNLEAPIKTPSGFCFSVFAKSTAEGNDKYRGAQNPFYREHPNDWLPLKQDRFYVGAIVETGIGYSWKNSRYYNPLQLKGYGRPIYEKAGEKLTENGQLASMIASELAKRGW